METLIQSVEEILGHRAKLLSSSKTEKPGSCIVWNSNVVVHIPSSFNIPEAGRYVKVWHGDIELSSSKTIEKLKQVANELNVTVYVLREMAGRFEYEKNPLVDEYFLKVDIDGTLTVSEKDPRYELCTDTMTVKPTPKHKEWQQDYWNRKLAYWN